MIEALSMRCDTCDSSDVLAIAPGHAPERSDLFLLDRGAPMRCWCWRCWTSTYCAPQDHAA
jgi:hypothetical protein